MDKLTKGLKASPFGDKGYISKKVAEMLIQRGLKLITKLQSNMKNKLLTLHDKWLLKQRGVIESAIHLMKFICNVEHSRHRSPANAFVNVFAALAAYTFRDSFPSILNGKNKNYDWNIVN